jgi:polar amino acid transport system substrate-binding protein
VIRSIIKTALVLSLVLGTAAGAFAADSALARIVENDELRVGTSGTQPPFTLVSKSGELIGFDIDLATLIADAMGVEVTFVQKPFGELLGALEKGEVDIVMSGMTMTPARNLRFAFVGPYMVSGKSILTTSVALSRAEAAEDIDQSQVRMAALKGSTSQDFVTEVWPRMQLTVTDSYDEAIQLLREDKVGAVVADFPFCALSVMRFPADGFATLDQPLTIEPMGVAMPPNDMLFVNMMENYLGALEGIGILELLEEKWFQDGSWLIQMP